MSNTNEYRKQWLKEHPNYMEEWREAHAEQLNEYRRQYYLANKERIRLYHAGRSELEKQQLRQKRKDHPERYRAATKRWREANKDKIEERKEFVKKAIAFYQQHLSEVENTTKYERSDHQR